MIESLRVWLADWPLAEPLGLLALAMVPLPWIASAGRKRIAWPTLGGFQHAPRARAGAIRHLPALLISAAIACLAVALARPRAVGGTTHVAARGVAIVVAIDRSASMNAADFPSSKGPISRLDVAKETLDKFIRERPDDLIGVFTFADIARPAAPPTLDHEFVLNAVRAIRPARSGEGGTALGHAITWGLDELRGMKPPRKVLILLTDGHDAPPVMADGAPISPEEAASLSRPLGITLHTIAVGAPATGARADAMPIEQPGPDVARLRVLARLGGGRAFVASDAATLDSVFAVIDALERSPVAGTIRTRYREGYPALVAAALICLGVATLLRIGPLRSLP